MDFENNIKRITKYSSIEQIQKILKSSKHKLHN